MECRNGTREHAHCHKSSWITYCINLVVCHGCNCNIILGKVKRILYFWEPDVLHLKVKAKLCASRTFADARFDAKHWLSNLPVFTLADK